MNARENHDKSNRKTKYKEQSLSTHFSLTGGSNTHYHLLENNVGNEKLNNHAREREKRKQATRKRILGKA
jgi:hypothetical protein